MARSAKPRSANPRSAKDGPAKDGPQTARGLKGSPQPPRRASSRGLSILRRSNTNRRLNATMLAVGLVVAAIGFRLIEFQGVDGRNFRMLSEEQNVETLPIASLRGEITSSDGIVLAMTVQTDQVQADPPLIMDYTSLQAMAQELAGPLQMNRSVILHLLRHPTSPENVVLKQSVNLNVAGAISKLNNPGLALTPVYTRVYPGGDLAAGLLGFVNTDQNDDVMTGEAGLEEEYNRLLSGKNGKQEEEFGPDGIVPNTQTVIKNAVPAGNLRLTIQSDIEWEAQRECAIQVRATEAKNCSVIVIQPRTGRILALAQYPDFNPNLPITNLAETADLPVSEVFAPGSTAKVMTAAAAFLYAKETPLTSYLVPWRIDWHGAWYHDAEYHPTLRYTIAGIIAHSLNDGMIQVAQNITPEEQYREIRKFGIGSYTGLNLPGESAGLLPPVQQWTGPYRNERYQISFGQSVGVTAIQMAEVYATIANGGVAVAPQIVAGHTTASGKYVPAKPPATRRVIPASTAGQLIESLDQVSPVYNRAGEPWGLVNGYTVASKTGTSQEPGNIYGASFIGIAPASSTNNLVVAVNVQDPRKGSYFGISVAGPIFNAVMKFALATMKIPPDGGHVPYVPLTQGQAR